MESGSSAERPVLSSDICLDLFIFETRSPYIYQSGFELTELHQKKINLLMLLKTL